MPIRSAISIVGDIQSQRFSDTLSVTLFDDGYDKILSNVAYEIEGPSGEKLTGVTDQSGHLEHKNVKPGTYKVKIADSFAFISSFSDISNCHQRIPGSTGTAEAQDESGEVVTANESVSPKDEGAENVA
jgi:hypothetical protein